MAAVVVLTCAVADHRPGLAVDRRALRWLVDHRGDASIAVFRAVSHLGDPVTLVVIALVAGLWLARRGSRAAAVAPAVALLAASVTETIAKQVIGRSRPPAVTRLLTETDPSFPSGHTTGTAALLMAIALVASPQLRSRSARIAAIAGAGLTAAVVGFARMVLGVHWTSDVAAGWFLGTAWAVGVLLLVPWAEKRLTGLGAPVVDRPVLRSAGGRTSSVDVS